LTHVNVLLQQIRFPAVRCRFRPGRRAFPRPSYPNGVFSPFRGDPGCRAGRRLVTAIGGNWPGRVLESWCRAVLGL